jgi:FkbM family methyltransferase
MLYLRVVGAGRAVAGYLARLANRYPVGAKVLRSAPLPAKRLVVHRLSTTIMPSSTRARVGGVLFDLDLRDLLQRSIYFNAYERRDLRLALKLTPVGGVCLDIGSNIGYYALNLARKVGPAGVVHSFEPDPANYERLVGNCLLNGLDGRIRTSRIALSSRAGEAVLHMQPGRSGDGTLAGFGDEWAAHETVRTETLDSYLECNRIRRVDLAKIDVEGHEFEVLEGAARALEHRVIRNLLIEFNGSRLAELGHTLHDFLGVLTGYDYTPVRLNLVLLRLLERGIVDPTLVSVNFLFQPASSR